MLDLNKLYMQIDALGAHQQKQAWNIKAALDIAKEEVKSASENIDAFRDKVSSAKTSWLVAIPTEEAPFKAHPPVECPESYTVLSTDGSQINPDRHSPHPAYLINIGQVELGYGKFLGYKFESDPYLFFEEKDIIRLFGGEERSVSGSVLAALRQKMEMEALSSMIGKCDKKPAVALTDGTLILWSLETNPELLLRLKHDDLKKQSLVALRHLISTGKHAEVPIAGYISSPGSKDVVNMLKISLCPSEIVDCDNCRYDTEDFDGTLPCAKINGVTDAGLFHHLLQVGERSSIFKSRSEILEAYGEDSVFFFYINAGKEIARVEVPGWIEHNKEAIGLLHSICLDQAEKGMGYPVAVAEAHEQAVVKSTDKSMFDQLVLQSLIKRDAPVIESRKSLRKRGGFI